MQQLIRIGTFVWPYRRRMFLSILCAVLVSAFWSMNLSITFPVVRVLFADDSLHSYADREIRTLQADITQLDEQLASVPAGDISETARLQRKKADAAQSLATTQWIKDYVLPLVPRDKFQTILLILVVVVSATALKGVAIYAQEMLVGGLVNATANDIRTAAFSSSLELDSQSLASIGNANLTSKLTNDVNEMSLGLRMFGAELVREPLKALLCILAAFYFNWRLTLLAILVLPLIGLLFHRSGRLLRKAARSTMETMSGIYRCITETLDATRIVIAFGGQEHHRRNLKAANNEYYEHSLKLVRVSALIRPVTELLGVMAFTLVLIPGAYMVLNGTDEIAGVKLASRPLEMAELATLYALLAGVLDPVRKLSGVFPVMRRSMSASDRVFELIDQKTRVPDAESPVEFVRHNHSISFENVSFCYHAGDCSPASTSLALKSISLTIPFGEVVAVVGGNGSGKSTLLSLLPRLMDTTDGAVRIDGVDVRDLRLSDLRSQMGIVTQDTMLFDDSVYNNVLYGKPDATSAEVEEAVRMSHASDFISMLPEGLNTRIGPRGQKLSGGQRQRISLARAILRNPSILILDEATSAIDAESEAVIYKVLRQFAAGRTI
ncbi:MAG: ABC transporter ATP-binding protein, partial [Planctomycetaceae bacterium]|nr:ABC transporter ATP-binding protein [Planctomycetaceae bacterium]